MEKLTIDWDDRSFEHLREMAGHYRMPEIEFADDWSYGCSPSYLRELREYWLNEYDLVAAASELNRYPHVMTRVDDIDIHAVHVVGEAEGRRPLLLIHGWPGSFYEFWQVIEPLAFPSRSGGDPSDAFDLVIPSLPGFGFSGKPSSPIGARMTARLFDELMRRLGYQHYRAQGGDWGSAVCTWLALEHPASLEAIHLNFLLVQPAAIPETEEEAAWQKARTAAQMEFGAYAHLQGTKPASLAYAMKDNPIAAAAWLVERFHDWADLREKRFEEVFSKEQLLTNIMIYLMNDAFISATYYYAAAISEEVREIPASHGVHTPTAFTAYPDPRSPPPPRSWVERGYNLVRWREAPRGGHFAAMEEPGYFVEDIRDWAGRRPEAHRADEASSDTPQTLV